MTEEEALSVYVGQYLTDTTDGGVFKVLCNCGSSSPKRYTQRYIQSNPEEFEHIPAKNLAELLGVPYEEQTP